MATASAPKATEAFDPDGRISIDAQRTAVHGVIDQVLWAARRFSA